MKNALRRPPVAARVVQHPLRDAVRLQIGRRKPVPRGRQRHFARQAYAVQHKGVGGQSGDAIRTGLPEHLPEVALNPLVRGTQVPALI